MTAVKLQNTSLRRKGTRIGGNGSYQPPEAP